MIFLFHADAYIIHGPDNQTVFVNGNATFRCCITENVTHTRWTVNGQFIDSNSTLRDAVSINRTTINGTLFDTLVIPASVVNNNSAIVCVAYGKNDSASSESAILTKQGEIILIACEKYTYTIYILHTVFCPHASLHIAYFFVTCYLRIHVCT